MSEQKSGCLLRSCIAAVGGTVGVIVIILLLPVILELFLWGLGGYLVIADPIEPSQAIAILSGGDDEARLEEAARLFSEGFAERIIVTETEDINSEDPDALNSVYVRRELELMGVSGDAVIVTEKVVSSTWGEARVIRKLLLREGIESCIVVTDPFHTRRTRIIFRDEFEPHGISLSVRPSSSHWYHSTSWWTSRAGWDTTLNEYVKLFAYWVGLRED
jgi:uncharacterized SAM-binding protein YcdF (DUF218 family)